MGSYKASKNNQPNPNEMEEVEERPKTKDEISDENNANTVKNAAEVAIASKNPYAMAAGYAVKGIDKITGGKASQGLGKAMTKINKTSPGGRQVQNLSDKLSESGAGDKIGQAASMKSGGSGGAGAAKGANAASNASKGANAANNANKAGKAKETAKATSNNNQKSSTSSSDSGFLSNNIMSGLGGLKIKLAFVGIFSTFIIFMSLFTVFAQKDQQNLALTNNTALASSSAGSKICTPEEIVDKVVYVGDSRMVGMQTALESNTSGENAEGENEENSGSSFIAKSSQGLSWFQSTALPQIEEKLTNDPTAVIVLNFGVNDLHNIDGYISEYTALFEKYPSANFYVLSVNPVDEETASANGYPVKNVDIEAFNQKLQAAFSDKYIDSYSSIKSSLGTSDGLHYDNDTYNNINQYVLSNLSSSGNVKCSIGSIASIDESSLSGNGGNILGVGQSLLSVLGQEKLDNWNASLKSDIQAAGIGSGAAPAMAAYGLVQGALNEGIVIPYFWGGGHGAISDGINGSWGAAQTIGVGGSSAQPKGSTQPAGLDCSGFVSWALKNGGCSNFSPILADSFKNLGSGIDPSQAVAGDIASSNSHVMIILNNTGSSLIVAEAKGASYGIIFSDYDYSKLGKYKIVSMGDYYSKNCNG